MRKYLFLAAVVLICLIPSICSAQDLEILPGCVSPDCSCTPDCSPPPPPPDPPPPAPKCYATDELADFKIGAMAPGQDGKIHVKYGYFGDGEPVNNPGGQLAKAFSDAFAEWNSKSDTTKIVFELAGPNERPQIPINLTSDSTSNGRCIAMNPGSGFLNYSPDFVSLANAKEDLAAAAAKHELIHFLGVDDIPYSAGAISIASQNAGTCTSPVIRTSTIQAGDASKAGECTLAARNALPPSGGGGGPDYVATAYTPCYQLWDAYDVYSVYWNDGWHWEYVGTLYVLDYSECGGVSYVFVA